MTTVNKNMQANEVKIFNSR